MPPAFSFFQMRQHTFHDIDSIAGCHDAILLPLMPAISLIAAATLKDKAAFCRICLLP